ncbi:hypothetical protein LCGC14_1141910 [marine sediment metagenome]|uniref:Sulfatase N-terminal domain-containing protein n=1 Tax=marine sediment metagenome TaxID=412755 RepID=A0A0F9M2U6_9ZZZZ
MESMPRLGKLVRQDGWEEWAQHYGVSHCSDPNFLSLLTGAHPDETGVQAQMGRRYVKEFPTLQKRLGKAGYFTWAYEPIKVPMFYMSGFDELIWHKTQEVSPLMAPAPKKAIQAAGSKPWFGFMRIMDTHYPYNGEPLVKETVTKDYSQACYHMDKFITHLSKWVLKNYPNTIIVIGADHGEMLGEHGLWDHLFTLKNPLVHVPLMVHVPDGGLSRVRSDLTQHTDVTGLILERTGLIEPREPAQRDGLWMSAWGMGFRDPWKHRSLVAQHEGIALQYTVNWHVEHGASFELHAKDDHDVNLFGNNDVSRGIAEALIEKYPTFPRPNFSLPPGRIQGDVNLLAYDAVALGDGVMLGEDGMGDEQDGAGATAISLRPDWREPAILS